MRATKLCLLLLAFFWVKAEASKISYKKITVAIEDSDSYPFQFHEPNQRWTGFHIELIEAVAKDLGLHVEWLAIPWPRAQTALRDNDAQAISYFVPTPGKPAKGVYLSEDNILHYGDGVFFIRKDREKDIVYKGGSITSIGNFTIGINHGDVIEDYITNYYPTLKVDNAAKNLDHLFKMLLEKRFDTIIADSYGLQSATRKNPALAGKIKKLDPPIASGPCFIAFAETSRGRKLGKEFGLAFRRFRLTDHYKSIINKYDISSSTVTKH